jgi:hypothetical protein
VVELLDEAGIERALVLSMAYTWGKASRAPVENEYEHVKAENDWTAQQVAQYPTVCARSAASTRSSRTRSRNWRAAQRSAATHGLKLHFGNSDVDLDNPDDVAQ